MENRRFTLGWTQTLLYIDKKIKKKVQEYPYTNKTQQNLEKNLIYTPFS